MHYLQLVETVRDLASHTFKNVLRNLHPMNENGRVDVDIGVLAFDWPMPVEKRVVPSWISDLPQAGKARRVSSRVFYLYVLGCAAVHTCRKASTITIQHGFDIQRVRMVQSLSSLNFLLL